jgi:hypothetical protein
MMVGGAGMAESNERHAARARRRGRTLGAALGALGLSAAAALNAIAMSMGSAAAVTGGVAAAEGAHPFAVQLAIGTLHGCSGALVSPGWVLTAKSCFPPRGGDASAGPPVLPTRAIVGRADLGQGSGHVRTVVEVVPHPERNVALARLDRPVRDIAPVPIGSAPAASESVTLLGYGRTATEWVPDRLQVATAVIDAVTASLLELSSPGAANTCKGDSGGPALRATPGGSELVAVHHTSGQRGCYGDVTGREGTSESRVDDLAEWVSSVTALRPTATMAIASNADGRLEILSVDGTGELFEASQLSPGGEWSTPGALAMHGVDAAEPVAIQGADGRLHLFHIGDDDVLQHAWQVSVGGAWSDGSVLGSSEKRAKALSVARNADGRLEVMYVGVNDVPYHTWELAPGGDWSGEFSLGTVDSRGKRLVSAVNVDGRIEVIYIGTDDVLYHNWQVRANGSWFGERVLVSASTRAKQLSVGVNANGSLEVVYTDLGDVIYHTWQVTPGGSWSGAHLLGAANDRAEQLAVATNADGRLEVFYVGTNDVLYHNWQLAPSGVWSGQRYLQSSTTQGKQLRVIANLDGRLEAFYLSADGAVLHDWQVAAGGGWVGGTPLF